MGWRTKMGCGGKGWGQRAKQRLGGHQLAAVEDAGGGEEMKGRTREIEAAERDLGERKGEQAGRGEVQAERKA